MLSLIALLLINIADFLPEAVGSPLIPAAPQCTTCLNAEQPMQESSVQGRSTEVDESLLLDTGKHWFWASERRPRLRHHRESTNVNVTFDSGPENITETPSPTITRAHRWLPKFWFNVPGTSLVSLSTSAVQTATTSFPTSTQGILLTSLETSGFLSTFPFPTSIPSTVQSSQSFGATSLLGARPTLTESPKSMEVHDIFKASADEATVAMEALPAQIVQRDDHPVPRIGIQPQQRKLQTNKFYANLFLGSQAAPVFSQPYSIAWSKGTGTVRSWGLAISHAERDQLARSPARPGYDAGQWAYFANPIGTQQIILSASELTAGTTLTTDTHEAFSVNANLNAPGESTPAITFPLLQGLAMITGVYRGATPLLQSGVGFQTLIYLGTVKGSIHKYRALLTDDTTWLIYFTPSQSGYAAGSLQLIDATQIRGPTAFRGTIQVANIPRGSSSDAEDVHDAAAGAYPTTMTLSGSVYGRSGRYKFSWTKQGIKSQQLLMFALPHHVQSMAKDTSAVRTSLQLITRTKGMATAFLGDDWDLSEASLPIDMGFAPWTPAKGSIRSLSAAAVQAINKAGAAELSQNISAQTNVGSLYYDGKALAKFANIICTLYDLGGNTELALSGLRLLQDAIKVHIDNRMHWPLVYDTAWGGVVSSATYITKDSGVDFGITYYNDHHFHYGYFVYAGAVIGYLDPSWLQVGRNKAWVNMLVRDFANSATDDPYFPFSRAFDWYHGHSWASGIFESFDGRNQESSSEDAMASYALKMWGQVSGDVYMQARGNLMLAIQARSFQNYFLYTEDNSVEPTEFVGNKAAGILFDNKIDHTTFFGDNAEYVEGIHMLPLMPFSTLMRTPAFVSQEWQAYFASTIHQVTGGWKGILMANYAIINARAAYDFFSQNFDRSFLDGGASQTWYLAWSAALGGA